ncbi:ABC transporter ATP-binding protein [Desulfogranum mediterraneum]|uniref:ABC transporter ATP-binding protein n=1 Tax=Desulfogranum mediterraneum TaxID=160661 RepID=UPI0004269076|nr:ABC transporter ATP-binding protein [Desulfogranum mediterraneum]
MTRPLPRPDTPAAESAPPRSFLTVLQLILPLFRQYRSRLLLGFAALVSVDCIQLLIPKILQHGVDSLQQGRATPAGLGRLSLMILAAALVVVVLRFSWRYLIIGFSRILERQLRNRMFSHVLTLDQPFFERWTTGELIAHATNDLNAVQMACGMGLVAAADAMVMSTAAVGFMLAINVKLTLLALLPMPLLALCTRILSARLHQRFNLVQEQFGLITEFVRSTLVSIQLIQGYTLEGFQRRRLARLGERYVRSNLKVAMVQGALFPISTLVGNIAMLLVLYNGGALVMREAITLGEFVAFITYMYMLIWPMMAVGWVANISQRGMTSLQRIHRLLQERPTIAPGGGTLNRGDQGLFFQCRNLSFSYPGSSRPALSSLNLEIPAGILGITGRTGSGKSTLCKLLLRIYPVAPGELWVNDCDVTTLEVDELRRRIAYVAQETVLFADTLANNIAFGKPEAGREEIHQAARLAAIHEDILRFPQGYEAVVGERGVKLSGGQRQRLALARALLCRRPVLIIDDGLNAIDVETEKEVIQGILASAAFKTVILVSHRINVLQVTDRIVIIEAGEIVAQGRHEQLLNDPFYGIMMEKQRLNA